MRIILFQGEENKEKILDGRKTMTARCWSNNYKHFEVGEIVAAQTGRKKDTRFAHLEITKIFRWHLGSDTNIFFWNDEKEKWESPSIQKLTTIAKKEGYGTWAEFMGAYITLNGSRLQALGRTNWFIEFKVIHEV